MMISKFIDFLSRIPINVLNNNKVILYVISFKFRFLDNIVYKDLFLVEAYRHSIFLKGYRSLVWVLNATILYFSDRIWARIPLKKFFPSLLKTIRMTIYEFRLRSLQKKIINPEFNKEDPFYTAFDDEYYSSSFYRSYNIFLRLRSLDEFRKTSKILKNIFKGIFVVRSGNMVHKYRFAFRLGLHDSKIFSALYNNTFSKNLWSQLSFGLTSAKKALRLWVLPLSSSIFMVIFLSFVRILPVNTALFQIFGLLMFFYWLISGFVFFIKKYKFSKFTSVIQRFWRRTYILFWLLESCLLLVFFYLTLNSSQESGFSLDHIATFKSHTNSIKMFLPAIMLSSILILVGYLLLLNLKWNFFQKQLIFVFVISFILIINLMQESYQMFHILNFYSNLFWTYSVEDKLWSLEFDARRTRLVNHYTIIMSILKYWHVVFIYFFWIFTALRSNESSTITYPLYSANFQNFIILFIMSFISLYPHLKSIVSPFLSDPYFWFFLNPNSTASLSFFNDIKLFGMSSLLDYTSQSYIYQDFFYFSSNSLDSSLSLHRKQFIRDNIVTLL